MQINLPDNHPSFTYSYEVEQMLNSFFPGSPLTFFQHYKINADGTASIITNRPDWVKTFFKLNIRKVYTHIDSESIAKTDYWHLCDPNLLDAPLVLARNEFNMANGLCFIERAHDCYYTTAFATNSSYSNAIDFYFNNFDLLKNFIHYFREKQYNLLLKLDKNRIVLSKEAQDPNKNVLLLENQKTNNKRISVISNNKNSYITYQEYQCIKRLPLGKTAKEIAQDLNISPRTVEGYFNRVMARTACKNKRELILLLKQITA